MIRDAERAENRGKFTDQGWYVMARVAETWGLTEVARGAYERAWRGITINTPTSTRNLARRGMDRLGTPVTAVAHPTH